MAFRRVLGAALLQGLLFGCGGGAVLAIQAKLVAMPLALATVALWIAAAASWQARLRPTGAAEGRLRPGNEAARAQLLASLLDQTPAPLITRDAAGVFRPSNRAARQLFKTDGRLIDPSPSLIEAVNHGAAGGRATAQVGEGDSARTYAVSLSDVLAEEGPLRLAVLLDIEPDLRAAEAGALRDLMQVLSHEIMNGLTPVASLAATAQDLLAAGEDDAQMQAREALEVLARRAEGLVRFAEGYRTLARLPPPVCTVVSLTELMEEAGRLFRSRWTDVGLEISLPSPDVRLALDRDQVMHALLNLLTNAAQAALTGGRKPQVELAGVSAASGGAVFRVRDNGKGVLPDARDHIGKPFFTTKSGGTGVGLSLARQIARAHGGSVELRPTEPDTGAIFELYVSG